MDFSTIPTIGWVAVILLIACVFSIIWFKNPIFKKGDILFSFGKEFDKKLAELKKTFEDRDAARDHDEEIRKGLFRESVNIDDKLKADMRRIVRSLNDAVFTVFGSFFKCDFPSVRVIDIIKSELLQRIDENHMRERLRSIEIQSYIDEILADIRKEYEVFLKAVNATACGESYPAWEAVAEGMTLVLMGWAEKTKAAICARTREKIALYTAARTEFALDDYKKTSVDDPVKKNEGYLASLENPVEVNP